MQPLGENSLRVTHTFILKESMCNPWEKILSSKTDPFSEDFWYAEEQTGTHKSCQPCKMTNNLPSLSSALKTLTMSIVLTQQRNHFSRWEGSLCDSL